jgi:sigma-B regulation protein RsbU (phosphoserine phosphatase)
VLGFSTDSLYRVDTVTIPPGGTIVLFTDGVTECLSPSGDEFGATRIAAIAGALERAPAASVVTTIFEALSRHSRGAALVDDATVVVVRREA